MDLPSQNIDIRNHVKLVRLVYHLSCVFIRNVLKFQEERIREFEAA